MEHEVFRKAVRLNLLIAIESLYSVQLSKVFIRIPRLPNPDGWHHTENEEDITEELRL